MARSGHSAVMYDYKMYVYGGITGAGENRDACQVHGRKVHVFDVRINDWYTVHEVGVRLTLHSIGVLLKELRCVSYLQDCMFGGERHGHSAILSDTKIVWYGGTPDEVLGDLETHHPEEIIVFDPVTETGTGYSPPRDVRGVPSAYGNACKYEWFNWLRPQLPVTYASRTFVMCSFHRDWSKFRVRSECLPVLEGPEFRENVRLVEVHLA